MKKLLIVLCCSFGAGCASPAEDYVRAEASYDQQIDKPTASGQPRIDAWIDADASLSLGVKDALHQLNVGRRARVSHAMAQIAPVGS